MNSKEKSYLNASELFLISLPFVQIDEFFLFCSKEMEYLLIIKRKIISRI